MEDVSISISPGETVALVGANGVGKSTLLRIAAGLLFPSAGTVMADGFDAFAHPLRFRRFMGWLPESAPVEADMTVKAYLRYRARLKGEMTKKIRHRILESMDLCGLTALAEERIGALSFGQRKRVGLADAILLRPRFLFLDDLLAGLDADTRGAVGRILAAVSSFAAVLVSGHELEELQRLSSRFAVLKDGRILAAKTADGVRAIMAAKLPVGDGEGERRS